MQLVVAVIKPHAVDAALSALHAIEIGGVTVSEVRGHGLQRGHTEHYRGAEYSVDLLPKVKLEVLADDAEAERIADTIAEAVKSGTIGDGKVWILPVAGALRIRTGERDTDAIRA